MNEYMLIQRGYPYLRYRPVYRRPILVSDGPSQTETPVSRHNMAVLSISTAIDVRCHDLTSSKWQPVISSGQYV